jgi:hypothetical protein
MRGPITGVTGRGFTDPPLLSAGARARAEDALISAAENVLRGGDQQYGEQLRQCSRRLSDSRARDLLSNFANRNVLTEQSLIAIT